MQPLFLYDMEYDNDDRDNYSIAYKFVQKSAVQDMYWMHKIEMLVQNS